jgi:sugar/nucleoside kinase (ribokinase family)
MTKKYDVMVIGELNIDLILNRISGLPEVGKEKLAGQMDLVLGSSSAICASNLSSLGARVAFLGKIGGDSFAKMILSTLQNKGVETCFIIQDAALTTGATIVMNYNEDRAMVTYAGAMEHLCFADIHPDQLAQARHLHLSSYFLQPRLSPDIGKIFQLAKKLDLTTSFDAQWDPSEQWDIDLAAILPFVDVFLPNRIEAQMMSGEKDLTRALEKLSGYGNVIAVKLGSDGSLVKKGAQLFQVKPFINKCVVDAIGAGDSFDAGFIFKYIQGSPVQECQIFGNLMGAISTTQAGGTAAFVNYEQIMRVAGETFGYR